MCARPARANVCVPRLTHDLPCHFQLDYPAGLVRPARAVRVAVPAYNAATLAVRLRELGEVETLREEGNLLAEPNADVPVQIEIQY